MGQLTCGSWELKPRSNEASHPAPLQDPPRCFSDTLLDHKHTFASIHRPSVRAVISEMLAPQAQPLRKRFHFSSSLWAARRGSNGLGPARESEDPETPSGKSKKFFTLIAAFLCKFLGVSHFRWCKNSQKKRG